MRAMMNFAKRIWHEGLIYPIAVIFCILLMIFSVQYKLKFTELGSAMKSLSNQVEEYQAMNRDLETEIARLSYLPRVERFARDTCNMIIADETQKILVYLQETETPKPNRVKYVLYRAKTIAEDFILPDKEYVKGF